MEFVRLLLTGGLILIGARIVLSSYDENNSIKYRLSNYIKPKFYDIHLTINPNLDDDMIISGYCNISINVDRPYMIRNISLHAQDIQILGTYLYSDLYSNPRFLDKLQRYTYNDESHILTFHLNNEIGHGRYILEISFFSLGANSREGFFKSVYVNKKGATEWLVTNVFPIGARRIFPCWDEPAIKAKVNISVTHNRNYTILSSIPNREVQHILEEDMLLTKFYTTLSISTYQIAIAMVALDIHIAHMKSIRFILNFLMFIYHEVTRLGIKWGFLSSTQIINCAIAGFPYDSIGHWGLTFYRDTAIVYDDKIDPIGHKINVACLTARETARHWFNKISPSWWSHSWLHEGIVRMVELIAISKIFPDYRNLAIVQIKEESLRLDTQSIMKPLMSQVDSPAEINSLFSFSYYIKAPAILQMLLHLVTPKVFLKGLRNYVNRYMYGSATVDNFWNTMQDALKFDVTRQSQFNLTKIIYAWTYHAHYPVLNVNLKTQKFENKTHIWTTTHVWQENVNGTDWSQWWLPVTYAMQKSFIFHNISFGEVTWLSTSEKHVISSNLITEDDWIIANKKQIGYYRVNYDIKNWLRIARTLNSENYMEIDILNRAQIIDDAYHFLMTDKLSLSTFLELAKYLQREIDYTAWYPMFKALEDMSSFFPFQESAYIKDKMRAILEALLEEIEFEEFIEKDVYDRLRQEAAKWACILGSYECMEKTNLKLQSLIARKTKILLPYWKHWTYCNDLADYSTWFEVLNKYREEYDTTILKSVACSEHVTTICDYLFSSENYIKMQDIARIKIFHSIIARHAKNDLVLDYILANFEKIKPREVSTIALLINIINHVYSKENLDKITLFVEEYVKKTKITTSFCVFMFFDENTYCVQDNEFMTNIQEGLEKIILVIKRKIERRLSEIKSQINYYNKLVEIK